MLVTLCKYDHVFSLWIYLQTIQDTLQICTGDLYSGHLGFPIIPEILFLEFMYLAIEGVKFSFSDIMYAQIDEVPWVQFYLIFLYVFMQTYFLSNATRLILIIVMLMILLSSIPLKWLRF